MSVGLDTSVVLRLLIGEPSDQATAAWNFAADEVRTRSGAVLVSDLVVGEAYIALRHHYRVPDSETLAALLGLASDARFHLSSAARHAISAATTARGIPGFMDRLIHAAYRDVDAQLVTFDQDAGRLKDARVLR